MSTAIEGAPALTIDPDILNSIIGAVESCLTMCDMKASCVGVSQVPTGDPGLITGLLGIHGKVSGFITVNVAERVAVSAVGGLLQEEFDSLSHQVIDGVGEIANIIAGGIKNGLSGSPWAFTHVTVPSVIVGHNYHIAYAKGIQYLSATFEQQDTEAVMLSDRLLQVAISMIRL